MTELTETDIQKTAREISEQLTENHLDQRHIAALLDKFAAEIKATMVQDLAKVFGR